MRVRVVANLDDPYNRRVLPGAVEFLRLKHWEVEFYNLKSWSHIPDAIAGASALLMGIHAYEEDPIFTRSQLPIVTWSASIPEANWRRVMTDDFAVGRMAAEHLRARGFKSFVYFNDSPDIWSMRRRDGFLGRIESYGLSITLLEQRFDEEDPELPNRLSALPRPFGALVPHDFSALHFIAACRTAGLKLPQDVAVVGVNNDEVLCSTTDPQLTSIPLQTHRIGYESAALLAKLIERAPLPPWTILIPPADIVVRQSSDTLATGDQLVIDAVRYIRKNLAKCIGTKEIAAAMNVSRTTLDARFIAAIGRTAAAEIRRECLDAASQLLASTDLPMSEIARRSGFSSARQLSESFRHFVGQTPTAHRKQFLTARPAYPSRPTDT